MFSYDHCKYCDFYDAKDEERLFKKGMYASNSLRLFVEEKETFDV